MTKRSHPELDGQHPQTLYRFELKRPGQALRERLAWGAVGLSLGLALAGGYSLVTSQPRAWSWPPNRAAAAAVDNPFYQGSERAMSAAELTQTAEFSEEWAEVAMLWEQAIGFMQLVPQASGQGSLAQEKIAEYGRNLQYAQSNVTSRPSSTPTAKTYWTLGSDLDLVLAIQGTPSQTTQFPNTCQQTLRYGNSTIELNNGYVKQYNNADGTLKVLGEGSMILSAQAAQDTWTLGSSEAQVMQLQGTPTRQEQYTSNRYTTLYFDKSSVLFENGQVIGYFNADDNLKVSLDLPALLEGQSDAQTWSLGSSRTDVLRAEGQTPVAISRNDNSCEEIFHFTEGEVTFRQGIATGYRNHNQALKVR
ncbi:hypothetical protein [Nodosilinea sp. E11]|uniref:hypothetical protein n=1 Tax=Nodosilinea sp. E11 TaxID=3037479 RepID=UPI0029347D8B|nr:hypothetical protein [Nodosilinea sp. E11]WOD41081.1 hypothetical protein RRF56_09770 [Nodosilinea sp. E11]